MGVANLNEAREGGTCEGRYVSARVFGLAKVNLAARVAEALVCNVVGKTVLVNLNGSVGKNFAGNYVLDVIYYGVGTGY